MRRPALLLASAILLAGCDVPSLGMPDPVSKEGQHVDSLWRLFVVAGAIVFALVVGLILYAGIRFRRRNDDVPNQNAYNIPVEVIYTVTPILVVALLFGLTVAAQRKLTSTNAADPLVVEVTGFQWGWRFDFPAQHVTVQGAGEVSPPSIDLPVDRTVRFVLRTDDVIHSFWVPTFLEKRDLIQGIDNQVEITPTQLGVYRGRCAEFCGLDHWRMPFDLHVVTQGEFDAWVRGHPGATP